MREISELLSELTVEEKAALLEGADSWHTNAVPRLGIPSIFMTDGPHGLRKARKAGGGFSDMDNEPATAFPVSAVVASSWNTDNAYRMGQAIAEECAAAGVDVLLAPGVNIKRSPLCGRNFEYYSEDQEVSAEFGEAFVRGVQSAGVGCSLKHFAANSNENFRFYGDSEVDERALREIYLRAFEKIVRKAKPYTVMCAYNRLNGVFASQNKRLLTDILRDEWGFDGLVMSDWGAVCDRPEGVLAGCDLDMPGGVRHNRNSVIEAAESGKIPPEALDRAVSRVLGLVRKCSIKMPPSGFDRRAHAALACEIAEDGAVLLKNDGVLPLKGDERLLVVGEFFEKLRFQGAGSSLINPIEVVSPKNAFDRRGVRYTYEKGFRCFYPERDDALARAALTAAESADVILFFGGLTDFEESEGFDRQHMRIGGNQTALLRALIEAGKKVVMLLYAGAPVELPFFDGLAALLDMGLPGMAGGEATVALLFGEANPSGKLAESWPMRAEDACCAADFGRGPISKYYESVYVGYRFYDRAGTALRFPFGYGLSYTSFEYLNLSVWEKDGRVFVEADIRNVGGRDGAEAVQLYVKKCAGALFGPEKELRAFAKVFLRAEETKRVSLSFEKADLACWDAARGGWVLENGEYTLCLAASAADIRLTAGFAVSDGEEIKPCYPEQVSTDYALPPSAIPAGFEALLGHKLPDEAPKIPLTVESPLLDFNLTRTGRLLYRFVIWFFGRDYRKAERMPDSTERDARLKNAFFLVKMAPNNTLRAMCMASGGILGYGAAAGLAEAVNGRIFRGLITILKREKVPPLPSKRRVKA